MPFGTMSAGELCPALAIDASNVLSSIFETLEIDGDNGRSVFFNFQLEDTACDRLAAYCALPRFAAGAPSLALGRPALSLEASDLLAGIMATLEILDVCAAGLLFAFRAPARLYERLCLFGVDEAEVEDDGTSEDDDRDQDPFEDGIEGPVIVRGAFCLVEHGAHAAKMAAFLARHRAAQSLAA